MWSNDIKCKYIFMISLKNLARKGLKLIHVSKKASKTAHSGWSLWCHDMETLYALLWPYVWGIHIQRPAIQSFDVVFFTGHTPTWLHKKNLFHGNHYKLDLDSLILKRLGQSLKIRRFPSLFGKVYILFCLIISQQWDTLLFLQW